MTKIGWCWVSDDGEEGRMGWARPPGRKEVNIYLSHYVQSEKVAIFLATSEIGEVWAHLSVNTPHSMEPGEFVLHHDVTRAMLAEIMEPTSNLAALVPLFENTGKVVNYGFVVHQPVYRLIDYKGSEE